MCGIAGIYAPAALPGAWEDLHRMTEAIAHRGPDSDGHWQQEGIYLGHRRLSILDLSEAGRQPMQDFEGRFTVIFNGEIYNYRELRTELTGQYPFHSGSDTEVLLAAWRVWGEQALDKLYGMFAFALWDTHTQQLWIVRDRLGIKPLYYAQQGSSLIFASEIRALLRSGRVPAQLNRARLGDFLAFQTIAAPDTLIQGVSMLMPGHLLHVQAGKISTRQWWDIFRTVKPMPAAQPYAETVARVRELLQAAVSRRLVSDVPLGAFLSGGIDSSAIVALMAQASAQPVDTFSVIFDEKQYDESAFSDLIAKKYSTRHHPILLRPADFLAELGPALAAMDHPSGDGPNSYVVSLATKAQGITVALSGLGGDEIFAGYPFFTQLPRLVQSRLMRLPAPLRRMGAGMARVVPGGRRGAKLAEVLSLPGNRLEDIFPVYRRIFPQAVADRLLTQPQGADNASVRWVKAHAAELNRLPLLSRISVAEVCNYMQNVLLRDTDQMSMAHALEVRVPFLDHSLVEYVLGIPDVQKYPHTPKKLLVDAMGQDLPREIWERKKMGFVFPWAEWLRHDLRSLCESRLGSLKQRGIFQPAAVDALWQAFLKGDSKVVWVQIWLLVVLEDWMARNGVTA